MISGSILTSAELIKHILSGKVKDPPEVAFQLLLSYILEQFHILLEGQKALKPQA